MGIAERRSIQTSGTRRGGDGARGGVFAAGRCLSCAHPAAATGGEGRLCTADRSYFRSKKLRTVHGLRCLDRNTKWFGGFAEINSLKVV